MKLLLIEDHGRLATYIRAGLEKAQFAIDHFTTGAEAIEALACANYDAMILDLGLPDRDGLDVLRSIRQSGRQLPILILTSRIQVRDRVQGLEAGADDYLTKPFAMEELVARIRAILRRPPESLGALLTAGNLSFDPSGRQAYVDDAPIQLSPRETGLLEHLLRRSGKVAPKALLEDSLYDLGDELSSNSLEVLVHRLRKRLAKARAKVGIHTVRGVGYMLIDETL